MKAFKITSVAAISGILLLVAVFNSSAQTEIFRVNHDSTEITFAGQKYIKQKTDMKNNNGIITEFYQDGNIGIGNGGHEPALHIYSGSGSVGLMPFGWNPSEKLIITSDSTVHIEPIPIGNSTPMKRIDIKDGGQRAFGSEKCPDKKLSITKDSLNNR
ncbi:MAG: hypothetical protein JJE17_10345 [Peptostreptococcaceae bacterium]|nr:hypothetical protein [Peptostreptococcaceae bacterium]